MTKIEFVTEYKRLLEEYPQQFSSKIRMELIERTVIELSAKWWANLVDRIIISNNPRLDVLEAARGETQALRSYRRTTDLLEALKRDSEHISDEGLANFLKKLGANDLTQAIKLKFDQE